MMEVVQAIVGALLFAAAEGVAWHLFRSEGARLAPALLTLANALGLYMKLALDRGWCLLPLLPITAASALTAVFLQRPSTFLLMLLYLGIWALAWWKAAWLVRWILRKERSELAAKVRDFLYQTFDYMHYAEVAGPLPEIGPPEKGQVTAVRTGKGTGERMSVVSPPEWGLVMAHKGEVTVSVNAAVRYQKFMGFGGAFTESSAELLLQLGKESQERVIEGYFSPKVGLNYEIGRLHMNSCDFSRGNWSCCDREDDSELESFSIDRYHEAMLPMVRRAAAAAGRPLVLFASPWSPPAWMKDTGSMCKGGRLKEDCRGAWAKFYVRFAEELRDAGLPLWGFTVQNEPDGETPWENCLYGAEAERDFIRDHLGPSLEASGMDLKIVAWDHNRDELFRRANVIYSDPEAAKYVWGMGWHWYGDPRHEWWADAAGQRCFDNVRLTKELNLEKHLMVTEVCQELGAHIGDWRVGERYAESILRDFNSWNEAWVDWNLILDTSGGHNHVGNRCSAPVICDVAKDRVMFMPSFYYIGQFSRFIQPGAHRVACSSSRDALEVTAFANPDETIVVVALNQTGGNIAFCLEIGPYAFRYEAVAHTITTFIIRP